jgi:hypothetical protein
MTKSYDIVDSLTSLAVTVHRILNHLHRLELQIKKGNTSLLNIKEDLSTIYEQWCSIYQNPSFQKALSLQYAKLERADSYLLGAYSSIKQDKVNNVEIISFIKIISELDLAYSNIQIEFVNQKVSTIENIIEIKKLYGFTTDIEEK